MTKRKLKPWVIPTAYVFLVILAFTFLYMLGNIINTGLTDEPVNNVTDVLKEEDEGLPVNKEIPTEVKIIKPFTDEKVTATKLFYDKDQDEATQQKSLIYYENIYMQNTGVLYEADNKFNVYAVLDGTVKNIKEDNILGTVIEIEHSSNLTSFYQSLSDVQVKAGDKVTQGMLIAKSGSNKIKDTKDNCLHFQVYHNGELLNPETFYNMNVKDLL